MSHHRRLYTSTRNILHLPTPFNKQHPCTHAKCGWCAKGLWQLRDRLKMIQTVIIHLPYTSIRLHGIIILSDQYCLSLPAATNDINWDEMFFWKTAGTPFFDHKTNEYILEEMKVEPVAQKLRRYKSKFLRHVTRMNSRRMAKTILNCRPVGRRRLGRPLKRLLDEAETGLSRPNWWRLMMMTSRRYFHTCVGRHLSNYGLHNTWVNRQ